MSPRWFGVRYIYKQPSGSATADYCGAVVRAAGCGGSGGSGKAVCLLLGTALLAFGMVVGIAQPFIEAGALQRCAFFSFFEGRGAWKLTA